MGSCLLLKCFMLFLANYSSQMSLSCLQLFWKQSLFKPRVTGLTTLFSLLYRKTSAQFHKVCIQRIGPSVFLAAPLSSVLHVAWFLDWVRNGGCMIVVEGIYSFVSLVCSSGKGGQQPLQGCIRNTSHYLQVESVILLLSSALGRPELECWVQSWGLQYERNTGILE